jgi:hypothetical protein
MFIKGWGFYWYRVSYLNILFNPAVEAIWVIFYGWILT